MVLAKAGVAYIVSTETGARAAIHEPPKTVGHQPAPAAALAEDGWHPDLRADASGDAEEAEADC